VAKKLRKHRISPARLFIEILIPWVVMAIAAIVLDVIGVSLDATIIIAVACALAVTFLINRYERARTRRHKP